MVFSKDEEEPDLVFKLGDELHLRWHKLRPNTINVTLSGHILSRLQVEGLTDFFVKVERERRRANFPAHVVPIR